VIVVGCGGTGGRIIPNIAQHIANHNNEITTNARNKEFLKHKMNLVLIDMDTVEGKNLKRQNFYAFDIGRSKSEVLAERFSALYGLEIECFNKPFAECNVRAIRNEHGNTNANYIIFDCTDNKKARESIEAFSVNNLAICISCGNEDSFGQVLVSNIENINQGRKKAFLYEAWQMGKFAQNDLVSEKGNPGRHRIRYLPTLLELYPNFKDTEKPSCTDMELQNDQSMPINMLVAQLAYNIFYDLVSGKPLNYNLVRCNINNTFSTTHISQLYAAQALMTHAVFGFVDAAGIEIVNKIPDALAFYRFKPEEVLLYVKDLGPHKYGLLKVWVEYAESSYRQARFDEVKTACDAAHIELLAYLNGE
jgi:hypothetical protein